MQKYRCPSCEKKIEVRRLFDGRYLIDCDQCKLFHITAPMVEGDEAYVSFLEAYDGGLVQRGVDVEKLLEKEGLIRSKDQLLEMLSENNINLEDLPKMVTEALTSRVDYVVCYKMMDQREPEQGCSPDEVGIDLPLAEALKDAGIRALYKFQEEAITKILTGEDVVIVAPTGSGKTEAFAAPILHLVGEETDKIAPLRVGRRVVRAILIYPTKALARDQFPKISRLATSIGARVDIFDGDTPRRDRQRIIASPPDVIITNLDTLHYHLMHRTLFSRLLWGVRHIVIDEAHVYTGTFGSNVHFIIKRLERVCGHFQVVAASATLGNPKEFCESLFGRRVSVVSEKEGRRGRLHFIMLFPSMRAHRSLIIDLLKRLASYGHKTLVFSSSHLGAELTAFYARRSGIDVAVHRAGLLPSHRKKVEGEFKMGLLKALSSTPTLELGIDIGSVDAVLSDLVNVTRMIHRVGRAGRRGQESIAIVALRDNDPISQYYRNNPDDYFEDQERGYVDPLNPLVAKVQLLAAAMDRPLLKGHFETYEKVLAEMLPEGLLLEKEGRLFPNYPLARRVLHGYDIRGCGERVVITLNRKKVGERSLPQAIEELHPGAVYFLASNRYQSVGFRFEKGAGEAMVKPLPHNYPYYTKPLLHEWPTILKVLVRKMIQGVEVAYCDLLIEKRVIGYVNREVGKEGRGQKVLLDEPVSYEFKTKGIVFRAPIPQRVLYEVGDRAEEKACSSYHATEHVTIEGTNMITGGAAQDMGGIALGSTGLIFIYDGSPGGNGATKMLFDRLDRAFKRASEIVKGCRCTQESGCPRCTYSYKCGNNNEYLSKWGAMEVLAHILTGEETKIGEPIPGERAFV